MVIELKGIDAKVKAKRRNIWNIATQEQFYMLMRI